MIEKLTQIVNTWEMETVYFLVVVGILFVLFVLMVFLWSKIKKSIFSLKKKLVYQYDTIFYHLAKFQEENKQSKTNTYLFDSLFMLHEPNYIKNYQLIMDQISGLKSSLWQNVVPEKELLKLSWFNKRLKIRKFLKTLIAVFAVLFLCLILALYIRVYVI